MTSDTPLQRSRHERFRFRTAGSLRAAALHLGLDLPWTDDVGVLLEPLPVGTRVSPNRLAIHPMEGCDAEADGSPGDRARARYEGYARGGSGLIWFEATSVVEGGRSNPHQLMLTRETLPAFANLVAATRRAATESLGAAHRPILVLQLTHSGRFSYLPEGARRPTAFANPHLDRPGEVTHRWADEELDELLERFVEASALAREAGFDLVDIKACHGYLLHELLAAHTREASRYGGSLENRSRFLLEVIRRVRATGTSVAVRMNAVDGLPHPYAFGGPIEEVTEGRSEVLTIASQLHGAGCELLNVTAGIPASAPHIGRPFDRPTRGTTVPPEHPLVGVTRLIDLAGHVQCRVPSLPVVGTGYSWLRQYWPHVAAGVVGRGMAAMIGLGRGAFAYPDAPLDLMRSGRLDQGKCCVGCSHCTELMRARVPTGCVVRTRRA